MKTENDFNPSVIKPAIFRFMSRAADLTAHEGGFYIKPEKLTEMMSKENFGIVKPVIILDTVLPECDISECPVIKKIASSNIKQVVVVDTGHSEAVIDYLKKSLDKTVLLVKKCSGNCDLPFGLELGYIDVDNDMKYIRPTDFSAGKLGITVCVALEIDISCLDDFLSFSENISQYSFDLPVMAMVSSL